MDLRLGKKGKGRKGVGGGGREFEAGSLGAGNKLGMDAVFIFGRIFGAHCLLLLAVCAGCLFFGVDPAPLVQVDDGVAVTGVVCCGIIWCCVICEPGKKEVVREE